MLKECLSYSNSATVPILSLFLTSQTLQSFLISGSNNYRGDPIGIMDGFENGTFREYIPNVTNAGIIV